MPLTMTKYNDSRRLLSPALWAGAKVGEIRNGEFDGVYFFDDFANFAEVAVGAAVTTGPYVCLSDTGSTIKQGADNATGTAVLTFDATDEDEIYLTTGGNAGGMMQLNTSGSRVTPIWFECRFKVSTVANGDLSGLIGFAEEGSAAANFVVDGGLTLVDKDYLGFRILGDDGDSIDFVHHKAGGGTAAGVELVSNLSAIAADTFIKLGWCYDPTAPASKKIRFYVNGVEYLTTYGTSTTLGLATFPTAEEMALFSGWKSSLAAAKSVTMDWWAFCQHG